MTNPLPPLLTRKDFENDEEYQEYLAIESDDYEPVNLLTPERKAELKQAARNTLNEKRVQITLRIPGSNLSKIKALALAEGIPYQSYINHILHKAVR